jgi:hypothetical protein
MIVSKSSVITQEFKAIQISLEALEPLEATQRQFAVTMILSRLGMAGAPVVGTTAGAESGGTRAPANAGLADHSSSPARLGSVKDFLKSKAPTTDRERLICLAYYLTHARDNGNFSTRDITKLNAEAHGADFSNPAATAMNCVNQSKFLSAAGGGKKRITTLGEAVVEALPDQAKVKEVLAGAPRRRKKRAATKRKTAK